MFMYPFTIVLNQGRKQKRGREDIANLKWLLVIKWHQWSRNQWSSDISGHVISDQVTSVGIKWSRNQYSKLASDPYRCRYYNSFTGKLFIIIIVLTCCSILSTLQSSCWWYFSRSAPSLPQNSLTTFSSIIGLPSSRVGGAPASLGTPSVLSSTRIQWISCCSISSAANYRKHWNWQYRLSKSQNFNYKNTDVSNNKLRFNTNNSLCSFKSSLFFSFLSTLYSPLLYNFYFYSYHIFLVSSGTVQFA